MFEAAIFLGVEPWKLARQAHFWRDKALVLKRAHNAREAAAYSR